MPLPASHTEIFDSKCKTYKLNDHKFEFIDVIRNYDSDM